jgi:D-serine deaminase-like pyridoxal phosphate-dependent protein
MRIDDLETPTPTVDLDIVTGNLERAARYFARHSIAARPHIKTHKIAEFARLQLSLGACGITCQKLGEAEVMVDGGVEDILLTFPIVGRTKLERLETLARRAKMSAVADSIEVAMGLAAIGARLGHRFDILVECDVGGRRCGLLTPEGACDLARQIDDLPGARFAGLMTYPPVNQIDATRSWLLEALALLASTGLDARHVSVGGTPEMYRSHELQVASEHRPGTFIYSDRYMVHHGVGSFDECALKIIATVVSRPAADRAIIDAGSKTLSSDLMGFSDHGHIIEYPDIRIAKLSEEHGHLDLSQSAGKPKIGERLTIVPNHACAVTNLFDEVAVISGGRFVKMLRVDARGLVR